MTMKELIEEVISLPVEERAIIADSILRSPNPPESDMDCQWTRVAQQRLEELRSGTVQPIPGEQVFAKALSMGAMRVTTTHIGIESPNPRLPNDKGS